MCYHTCSYNYPTQERNDFSSLERKRPRNEMTTGSGAFLWEPRFAHRYRGLLFSTKQSRRRSREKQYDWLDTKTQSKSLKNENDPEPTWPRLKLRTTEDSSFRRIMHLAPVFTLETNSQTKNEWLPKFVQTDNAPSSIKTANIGCFLTRDG